ncbi:hypothetical protein F4778DRAFT_750357 [Xylariomycetidae sp. FL2044]|nr:hypothetical protein F4778DRAFT_750357 [Xylariomycetidae sp. FL2044]
MHLELSIFVFHVILLIHVDARNWGSQSLLTASKSLFSRQDEPVEPKSTSPCEGSSSFTRPEYQISGFQYNETIGSPGLRAITRFQLRDAANNYSMSCATPYLQDPSAPLWNDCEPAEDELNAKTIFQHLLPANNVTVRQTWFCEQDNGSFPLPYLSEATLQIALPLDCVNGTAAVCSLPDDQLPTFNGSYTVPIWNSDGIETISPSPKPANISDNPPWNPTPCVGTSFSYPDWTVNDFSYNITDGASAVSLALRNHGNNQSTTCVFTAEDEGFSSCDNSTQVQLNQAENVLTIRQSWQCVVDDQWIEGLDPITFNATGAAKTPIDCERGGCQAPSTVVKGTLTQPIEFTPNVAPQGVNFPGCLNSSETPSWEITSFVWHQINRGERRTGTVEFTARNLANDFQLTCETQSDGFNLDSDERDIQGCALEENQFEDYRIFTDFSFDPRAMNFTIDQRWYCNEDGGQTPAKFRGVGTMLDPPLDCSWANNTSIDEHIQTCILTGMQQIDGNVTERTDLAPGIFEEAPMDGYSCTISSVVAPKWRLGWNTDTLYTQPDIFSSDTLNTSVTLTLNILGVGTGIVDVSARELTPGLSTSDPSRWYDCFSTSSDFSEWNAKTVDCRFQLDLATGYFALRHAWLCSDKNPDAPILFNATASRYYGVDCYVSHESEHVTCSNSDIEPLLPTTLQLDTATELQVVMAGHEELGGADMEEGFWK